MNRRTAPVLPFALALAGCDALWMDLTGPAPELPCASDFSCLGEGYASVDLPAQPSADILFVIRNGQRAAAAQYQLARGSGAFFDRIDALGLDVHVGVISSDVGNSGETPFVVPTAPPAYEGNTDCKSQLGDDGVLQTAPCTQRAQGVDAAACKELCDGTVALAPGGSFLSRGPALRGSFACLALLGEAGCNVEGPLDASLRALSPQRNPGFLRRRSVLALLYQSEEDDCSQHPGQRAYNDPNSRSCVDPRPASLDDYLRCFHADLRCFVRAVACGADSLLSPGAKTGCAPRAPQEDTLASVATLAKDVRSQLGGRGDDQIYVAGLWAPPLTATDGIFVVSTDLIGKSASNVLNRAPACELRPTTGREVPAFPQVRLSSFAAQFKNHRELTLCQEASFSTRLAEVASAIGGLAVGCLGGLPQGPRRVASAGASGDSPAACIVGDIDERSDGSPGPPGPMKPPPQRVPQCAARCCQAVAAAAVPLPGEATIIAACQDPGAALPCFCVIPSQHADVCPGGSVVAVVRAQSQGQTPSNLDTRLTRVACARP